MTLVESRKPNPGHWPLPAGAPGTPTYVAEAETEAAPAHSRTAAGEAKLSRGGAASSARQPPLDQPRSSSDIARTAREDLKGMALLLVRRRRAFVSGACR
jgi:hypothetical protein